MNSSTRPLAGTVLGLSISESPDLDALGFSETHLQDALVELSRSMLAAGATLAYGGDLRAGGITHVLAELVNTYPGGDGSRVNRIKNYLAWPLYLNLSVEQRAELKASVDMIELPAPAVPGLDAAKFLPPTNAENTYVWCQSLTSLRKRMSRDIHAEILVGGRLIGYKGKYPGLVEEAYETLKAGKPLYLIGAFGGATGAVIDAILGNKPAGLTEEMQFQNDAYHQLYQYFNEHAPQSDERIDFEKLVSFFQEQGVTGLRNGLSVDENQRLFTTPHIPEIIALVQQGLIATSS